MPRLRITASLSLLALGIGVAGTAWLSDQTYGRVDVSMAPVSHRVEAHRKVTSHVAHRTSRRPMYPVAVLHRAEASPVAPAAVTRAPIAWVPVSMPVSSIPVSSLGHHDAGNLVLHLIVDGQGQVTSAALAQSSGDGVLDASAIAMARHWRFAVPPDRPQGFGGDLSLRFTGKSGQVEAQHD